MKINSKLKTDVIYGFNSNTNFNTILSIDSCKKYLLDRFELRNNIINSIKSSNIAIPKYHIIITYYNQYKDRNSIASKHRFIKNQMEEIFNPRYRGRSDKSSILFFCEKHKHKLEGGSEELIKNTITNIKEYDDVNKEITEGAYHSHILKSEIPDNIIFGATSKARKLMIEVFRCENIKGSITPDELQKIKIKLIKGICKRCDGVGNGKGGIKVVVANEKYYYDNYFGWEGYIAYCTKKCYNPYMMMDVIDNDNSTISLFQEKKPIKLAQTKSIYRLENE